MSTEMKSDKIKLTYGVDDNPSISVVGALGLPGIIGATNLG